VGCAGCVDCVDCVDCADCVDCVDCVDYQRKTQVPSSFILSLLFCGGLGSLARAVSLFLFQSFIFGPLYCRDANPQHRVERLATPHHAQLPQLVLVG